MNRESAIAALKNLQSGDDPEWDHLDADKILCALLRSLGYQAVVDEWEKVEKRYS